MKTTGKQMNGCIQCKITCTQPLKMYELILYRTMIHVYGIHVYSIF